MNELSKAKLAQAAEQASLPEPGAKQHKQPDAAQRPAEIGGRDGPDPTRFGDWEKNGRCIDF